MATRKRKIIQQKCGRKNEKGEPSRSDTALIDMDMSSNFYLARLYI
jgi:hypothetical protein